MDANPDERGLSPLIDAGRLMTLLGDPDLVVLDATASLPGETFDPGAAFEEAHVPGARFFDLETFSDPDTTLPHMVPSAGRFARLAGALGVGDASRVVIYESRRLFAAARAWWLFRLFGHDRVHLLDGGLPAWREAGGPLEAGAQAAPVPQHFTPRFRASLLAGLGDVERHVASGDALILDARAAGRFEGTAPEPRPGIRAGHIEGSRNLPYGELIAADGRLRDRAALREAFASRGIDGTRPVITSCGTGVTASVLSLGLAAAGLADAALYDGSWTEWATTHPEPGSP